jgi:mannose-6-phosphate isomerase class I
VWDWNRPDSKEKKAGRLSFRALHIPDARRVLNFRAQSVAPDIVASTRAGEQELMREPDGHFLFTQINLTAQEPRFSFKTRGLFQSLTVIDGRVTINGVEADRGRSVLIPAEMPEVSLSVTTRATVLRSTLPV